MPATFINASTGRPMSSGSQSTYGSGLGNVYQYGSQNPAGPYAFMAQKPGGGSAGGAQSGAAAGGGSSGGADSAARKYLEGVVSGQNTPYNQTTRDNMYSQQSNMAAGAESGRNQQIAEQSAMGGASPSDPSYQRLIRQSMAQRQSQNQQSMGDIDRTANLANQQAQTGAAQALMGSEDERFALSQGMNQRASQMALSYLYGGGGGGQGSSVNNFNLPQQNQADQNYSWAQNQAQREQMLQEQRENAAWNNRKPASGPSTWTDQDYYNMGL